VNSAQLLFLIDPAESTASRGRMPDSVNQKINLRINTFWALTEKGSLNWGRQGSANRFALTRKSDLHIVLSQKSKFLSFYLGNR
jgi:hypothetical protein